MQIVYLGVEGQGLPSSSCDENSSLTCELLRGIPLSACFSAEATLTVVLILSLGGQLLLFFSYSSSSGIIPVSESVLFTSEALLG